MKRVLSAIILLTLTLTLVGCGEKVSQTSDTKNISSKVIEKTDEKTDEEIDKEIKDNAVAVNFVEINNDNWEGKAVYAEGTVSGYTPGSPFITFTLSVKEADGYGVYNIQTSDIINEEFANINDGDVVKIYGKVDIKNDLGMPTIFARMVEKK